MALAAEKVVGGRIAAGIVVAQAHAVVVLNGLRVAAGSGLIAMSSPLPLLILQSLSTIVIEHLTSLQK